MNLFNFGNIKIFILKKIRSIFRSFEKKEDKVLDQIIYENWKKRTDCQNLLWKNEVSDSKYLPKSLAICICFFYNESNFENLKEVCKNLSNLAQEIDVTIITNENNEAKLRKLHDHINQEIEYFNIHNVLEKYHPFLLPWAHFDIMKKKVANDKFTHFLFIEDDILISKKNVIYWVKSREALRPFNLIPAFLRTELKKSENNVYSTDALKKVKFDQMPKVFSSQNDLAFTNVGKDSSYQGCYFMDKDLMLEHLNGPSSQPDYGFFKKEIRENFPTREKANLGLMYADVPFGFLNRHVVPVSINKKKVYDYCLIKHLSNRFVNDENSKHGKIKINELFY
tara:strand:+ start:578 stop:1591 length:1014 start_codon:yes stop_codon:yes gene_type:complete